VQAVPTATLNRSIARPSRIVGAVVVVLLAAAVVCYLSLDGRVLERLAVRQIRWHTIPWVNAFRQLGKAWVPIWLVILWAAVSGQSRPLVTTLVALVLTMVVVVPLKGVTQRLRPAAVLASRTQTEPPRTLRAADRASFPSGDASTAFAVATTVAPHVTALAWPLLYGAAAGVGVLRVTAMSHFPSDVCAGAAIGILGGYLALGLWSRLPWLHLDLSGAAWRGVLAGLALCIALASLLNRGSPLFVFLRTYWPLIAMVYGGLAGIRLMRHCTRRHPQSVQSPPPDRPA